MASIRTKFEKNIKFQCILTTAPATTTTPGAGGRIVKLLLNEGLCGDEVEAWNHVILVGTKADRADKFDKKRFQDTIVKELFEAAPPGARPAQVLFHAGQSARPERQRDGARRHPARRQDRRAAQLGGLLLQTLAAR